jgi:hypothetical protein
MLQNVLRNRIPALREGHEKPAARLIDADERGQRALEKSL